MRGCSKTRKMDSLEKVVHFWQNWQLLLEWLLQSHWCLLVSSSKLLTPPLELESNISLMVHPLQALQLHLLVLLSMHLVTKWYFQSTLQGGFTFGCLWLLDADFSSVKRL
uniref:Uncharacterized protein n=1 Tax=Opuntia streptacantha TaxID=393608 RepID=A0A7C9CNA9_OPUST